MKPTNLIQRVNEHSLIIENEKAKAKQVGLSEIGQPKWTYDSQGNRIGWRYESEEQKQFFQKARYEFESKYLFGIDPFENTHTKEREQEQPGRFRILSKSMGTFSKAMRRMFNPLKKFFKDVYFAYFR